jgi:hypothetical protein
MPTVRDIHIIGEFEETLRHGGHLARWLPGDELVQL